MVQLAQNQRVKSPFNSEQLQIIPNIICLSDSYFATYSVSQLKYIEHKNTNIETQEYIKFLNEMNIFHSFHNQQLILVQKALQLETHVDKENFLYREGDVPDKIYMIKKGTVQKMQKDKTKKIQKEKIKNLNMTENLKRDRTPPKNLEICQKQDGQFFGEEDIFQNWEKVLHYIKYIKEEEERLNKKKKKVQKQENNYTSEQNEETKIEEEVVQEYDPEKELMNLFLDKKRQYSVKILGDIKNTCIFSLKYSEYIKIMELQKHKIPDIFAYNIVFIENQNQNNEDYVQKKLQVSRTYRSFSEKIKNEKIEKKKRDLQKMKLKDEFNQFPLKTYNKSFIKKLKQKAEQDEKKKQLQDKIQLLNDINKNTSNNQNKNNNNIIKIKNTQTEKKTKVTPQQFEILKNVQKQIKEQNEFMNSNNKTNKLTQGSVNSDYSSYAKSVLSGNTNFQHSRQSFYKQSVMNKNENDYYKQKEKNRKFDEKNQTLSTISQQEQDTTIKDYDDEIIESNQFDKLNKTCLQFNQKNQNNTNIIRNRNLSPQQNIFTQSTQLNNNIHENILQEEQNSPLQNTLIQQKSKNHNLLHIQNQNLRFEQQQKNQQYNINQTYDSIGKMGYLTSYDSVTSKQNMSKSIYNECQNQNIINSNNKNNVKFSQTSYNTPIKQNQSNNKYSLKQFYNELFDQNIDNNSHKKSFNPSKSVEITSSTNQKLQNNIKKQQFIQDQNNRSQSQYIQKNQQNNVNQSQQLPSQQQQNLFEDFSFLQEQKTYGTWSKRTQSQGRKRLLVSSKNIKQTQITNSKDAQLIQSEKYLTDGDLCPLNLDESINFKNKLCKLQNKDIPTVNLNTPLISMKDFNKKGMQQKKILYHQSTNKKYKYRNQELQKIETKNFYKNLTSHKKSEKEKSIFNQFKEKQKSQYEIEQEQEKKQIQPFNNFNKSFDKMQKSVISMHHKLKKQQELQLLPQNIFQNIKL